MREYYLQNERRLLKVFKKCPCLGQEQDQDYAEEIVYVQNMIFDDKPLTSSKGIGKNSMNGNKMNSFPLAGVNTLLVSHQG